VTEEFANAEGCKVITGKWVGNLKTPGATPVSSRTVATQVKTFVREDAQANTPPLRAARIVVSLAASCGTLYSLGLYDASGAFLSAQLDKSERLCVRGPIGICPIGPPHAGAEGTLRTRRAEQMWQELIYDTMVSGGFSVVEVLANAFYRKLLGLWSAGQAGEARRFVAINLQIKLLGKIGPGFEKEGRALPEPADQLVAGWL
jgi:hypothetical protein